MRRAEIVGQRFAQPLGSFGYFQCGEAVYVDVGRGFGDGTGDIYVVVAVKVGMDAALQADFRGAHCCGLGCALCYVVQGEEIRIASEVERERAFGEAAETAFESADIGVVDVAVEDPGDFIAGDLAAQLVLLLQPLLAPLGPWRRTA